MPVTMKALYTNLEGRLISENRSGAKRDYVADTLGNTVGLLDNTQSFTDTWKYWPFGEVASHTGSSSTPYTFCGTLGYRTDIPSKRIYVRARILQTQFGRWLTVDPEWPYEPAYSYCGNSPAIWTDSLGLMLDWWIGVTLGRGAPTIQPFPAPLPNPVEPPDPGPDDGWPILVGLGRLCSVVGLLLLPESLGQEHFPPGHWTHPKPHFDDCDDYKDKCYAAVKKRPSDWHVWQWNKMCYECADKCKGGGLAAVGSWPCDYWNSPWPL